MIIMTWQYILGLLTQEWYVLDGAQFIRCEEISPAVKILQCIVKFPWAVEILQYLVIRLYDVIIRSFTKLRTQASVPRNTKQPYVYC